MSGFLGLNASSQSTPTSFSFGTSSALAFGLGSTDSGPREGSLFGGASKPAVGFGGTAVSSGGFFLSSTLGSTGLFAGASSSPSSFCVSSSFGTPSSQAASITPSAPSFAFAQLSSAAPSASSEALSMLGASSSLSGSINAESSATPVPSSASLRVLPNAGAFSVFGGSFGNSGFGSGAAKSSSAAGTRSATAMSSAASSVFGPSPILGGSKPANPAFGSTLGIPQFNPSASTALTASSDSPFVGSSAYSSSQSTLVATTSSSPPGFPIAASPSATTSFGSASQSTIAVTSSSSAATMSPFSGFSFVSSVTPTAKTAPTSSSASGIAITTLSRPQDSSSSQFGGSKIGSTIASAVAPTSSTFFSMAAFSHPASTSATSNLTSASGISFPSSAPSPPASVSPAASSGFAFAAATLGSSAGFGISSGSPGAVNFSKISTSGISAAATPGATMTTATCAVAVSSTPATSAAGAVGALSTTITRTAKPPSEIVGKTVEEIIKEWTYELQERTSMFRKQAETLGEWDGRILGNRNLLIKLESEMASVVESQHSVERQLELIETHQQEVEKSLETIEEEVDKLYRNERPSLLEDAAAATRDLMFEEAEFVERELERMGEQVKETIQNLNAVQGGDFDMAEGASPLDLVVRILNNQLTSLLWIDEKAAELSGQMQIFADQGALIDRVYRGSRLRLI